MTFGVIWKVGHKFNRGKVLSVNTFFLLFFFAVAWGFARMLPLVGSMSVLFLSRLPKRCHTLITRTQLLGAS